MKDTCVVRINDEREARFYSGYGMAETDAWPSQLQRELCSTGVYSIRRVSKPSSKSVRVDIVGAVRDDWSDVPAMFDEGKGHGYGICSRFLHELGVTPPPKGKRKTLHLVVTKRSAEK